jgi:hypothetical protein
MTIAHSNNIQHHRNAIQSSDAFPLLGMRNTHCWPITLHWCFFSSLNAYRLSENSPLPIDSSWEQLEFLLRPRKWCWNAEEILMAQDWHHGNQPKLQVPGYNRAADIIHIFIAQVIKLINGFSDPPYSCLLSGRNGCYRFTGGWGTIFFPLFIYFPPSFLSSTS